jgi:hypothetical protein
MHGGLLAAATSGASVSLKCTLSVWRSPELKLSGLALAKTVVVLTTSACAAWIAADVDPASRRSQTSDH